MKIAIVGYGKMGRSVESVALSHGIEISKIISSYGELCDATFSEDEVVIEFTEPKKCFDNLSVLLSKKAKVVCGTTGWYEHIESIRKTVEKNSLSFIYGENFAIGVHLFWKLVIESAKLFNKFPEYQVSLSEVHHNTKKDFPSGTAQKTAELLIRDLSTKDDYVGILGDGLNNEFKDNTLVISCAREDGSIARHDLSFSSENDVIEINHVSKGRNGYALGAIKCAEWLLNKKGFFTIEDYMRNLR